MQFNNCNCIISSEESYQTCVPFYNSELDQPSHSSTSIKLLYALCSEINTKKTYGSDGILPLILKPSGSEFAPWFIKLFRLCLSASTFPFPLETFAYSTGIVEGEITLNILL